MKLVNCKTAKDLLLNGEVVAIPTETVYGLAGWIHSEKGLKNIFSTKERPFFDPLIVHVDTIEKARALSSKWTQGHEVLARSCWPGPLTLITLKNNLVSPLITAGLTSVGIRCPKHPEALKLLARIEGGLAAPSANKFGKTSPTSSRHVFEEFGDHVPILEGGESNIGIESTVVGIEEKNDLLEVKIYRPGYLTSSMIEKILKSQGLRCRVEYAESPVAPGQLKHHYQPKIPLVIVPENFSWKTQRESIENELKKEFHNPVVWRLPLDPSLASRVLYQNLRSFDQQGHDLILISKEKIHLSEEWYGIWNRLEKAQTFTLKEN